MIRRKLFLFAVLMILLTAAADSAGVLDGIRSETKLPAGTNTFSGEIISVEKKSGGGFNITADVNENIFRGRVLLSYYGELSEPQELTGCRVEFSSELTIPQGRRNPGCFDYRRHLLSEGITAAGTTEKIRVTGEPEGISDKIRRFLMIKKAEYTESLSENTRGLIAGVLFGDTGELREDVYEEFRNNGTAHILSVSGLHIGIIYGAFRKAAGKSLTKPKILALGAILFVMGTLASWNPPVIRSVACILLNVTAIYTDRRYDFLTATGAVALALMAAEPYLIFNAGFQMSFLAVCAIGFFMPHFSAKIPDTAAVTLSANIGLIPYQMFQFNSLSLVSFIANIPVVYLTGILMPAALADFVLSSAGVDTGLLRAMTEAIAFVTAKVNRMSALGGEGAIDVVSPPLWALLFFYFTVFFLASETFYILRARGCIRTTALIFLCFAISSLFFSHTCRQTVSEADVTFVDVGQGDCIHIRDGKVSVLIDGGGNINYNVGEKTVKPYLLKNGVRYVDLAIATHEHTDHYKGLLELSDEGMIKSMRSGITAGSRFRAGKNTFIECLWPPEIKDGQDENENCSVFMVNNNGVRILVTGDLDGEGEKKMLKFYKGTDKIRADVLKIGHHGSGKSTTDEFLKAVDPDICVIQSGKNNYGHPDTKIIEKCLKKDIIVLRNDMQGAVGLFTSGGVLSYRTMIDTG